MTAMRPHNGTEAAPTTITQVVRAFAARGDRPALTSVHADTAERVFGYADLDQAVRRTAAHLATIHGVRHGDRVITACQNSARLVIADLAVMALGAVVVPLDPRESPAEAGWAVERVRASLIVFDAVSRDMVGAVAESTGVLAASVDALDEVEPAPLPRTDPGDAAVILFTSGSTARPKGIVLSHRNLLANAASLHAVHQIGPADRHLCVLPLHHANAFGFSMVAVMSAGAHLVLMTGFQPLDFLAAVREHGPTVASLVPQLLQSLSSRPGLLSETSLRYVTSAAAPLSGRTVSRFTAATGLRVHQGYGLSECTNFATAISADISAHQYEQVMVAADPPSIGSAVPGCEVEVLGEGGFAADGEEGEIVVRGTNVMLKYWEDEAATRATLVDGWLRTGDEGFARTVGDRRFFFVTGRLKEMVIRLGTKISPTAVERELAEHGGHGGFAVVGFPHATTGEEVGVYLEQASADTLDALVTAIRALPFDRSPKLVLVATAPIPRTSTGKVRRRELQRHFRCFAETSFRKAAWPAIEEIETHPSSGGARSPA